MSTITAEIVKNSITLLTHFWTMLPIYTPWKHQETRGFLVFSGGYKMGNLSRKGLFCFLWFLLRCNIPAGIYLLKVNNRSTRTRCEDLAKLSIFIFSWQETERIKRSTHFKKHIWLQTSWYSIVNLTFTRYIFINQITSSHNSTLLTLSWQRSLSYKTIPLICSTNQ